MFLPILSITTAYVWIKIDHGRWQSVHYGNLELTLPVTLYYILLLILLLLMLLMCSGEYFTMDGIFSFLIVRNSGKEQYC